MNDTTSSSLQRFLDAQEGMIDVALGELERGRKESHWMWYIFPQVEGLGQSEMSMRFAIRDLDEARAYLAHPVLGERLEECCEALLEHKGRSATDILGHPDDMKLRSSMTLFAEASEEVGVYWDVLVAFFRGRQDETTLELLGVG